MSPNVLPAVIVGVGEAARSLEQALESTDGSIGFPSTEDRVAIEALLDRLEQASTAPPQTLEICPSTQPGDSGKIGGKEIFLVEDDAEEPRKKKKREPAVRKYDRVIVAILSGDDSDEELLHVTNEFVSTLPAKVVMLFPIVVPRNLPLQAPMPEVEEKALKAIELGKERMKKYKTAYEVRLERARDLPTLIHDVAEETGADRVIFAFSRRNPEQMEEGVKLVSSILQKVACPVMFVRGKTDV